MWNENTIAALRAWVGPETWHTRHSFDEGRFFNFVLAIWDEHHSLWDESLAVEIMVREAKSLHPDFGQQYMIETIDKRRSEGTLILDFLVSAKENGRHLQK